MAIQSMGGAEAGWEVACEVSVPLWVQTPSKALPLLACWRRTPNRCPFGHCWMRDHHSLRSHAPGRIGGVAGQFGNRLGSYLSADVDSTPTKQTSHLASSRHSLGLRGSPTACWGLPSA